MARKAQDEGYGRVFDLPQRQDPHHSLLSPVATRFCRETLGNGAHIISGLFLQMYANLVILATR